MRTSLITIILLVTSCQPSLAQQNDFSRKGFLSGGGDYIAPSKHETPTLFAVPSCHIEYMGKYGTPVEHCPTDLSPPKVDDTDDTDNRHYR